MKTLFLLMAQYDGRAVIPIEAVAKDYFCHLTPTKLLRKITTGEIALPVVRIEDSFKTAKGVHVADLAAYIDERAKSARHDCRQMNGACPGDALR